MDNKGNKKKNKKIRSLVLLSFLCAVVLGVATYAWFIGMKTVNVNKFDINIASTEGLYLSMDGETWSYNLDVTQAPQYSGNTNSLTGDNVQLIPMSSVGDMDATSSTMKLYEKGSLTATKGGYRLLASRVNNYTKNSSNKYPETKGYVAFDLFIKNLSGVEYYVPNDPLNEEAIYLTTNSGVTVAENGGVVGTGIENSVRVAFVQLGRTKSDSSKNVITAMTCADVTDGDTKTVTGICRDAQIWEPNDKAHETNAINWYNTSCMARKSAGANVVADASYEGSCDTVANNNAYPTYAISRPLTIDDNINVYDGLKYNKYTANSSAYDVYHNATSISALENKTEQEIATIREGYRLVDFPYFTDTMKDQPGTSRPAFMTLAPNSVTKIRVYIWIEGQDIDNYDFASLGHAISVNFGFTKERFTESDVSYDNLKVLTTDTTYQSGKRYYSRTGTEGNYTYTLLTPITEGTPTAGQYLVGGTISGDVYEVSASTDITPAAGQEPVPSSGNNPNNNVNGAPAQQQPSNG